MQFVENLPQKYRLFKQFTWGIFCYEIVSTLIFKLTCKKNLNYFQQKTLYGETFQDKT